MEEFKLAQRATHVFSEAARVLQFREAANKGDIHKMGALMNESHESCRQLYECSCDELDRTVSISYDSSSLLLTFTCSYYL